MANILAYTTTKKSQIQIFDGEMDEQNHTIDVRYGKRATLLQYADVSSIWPFPISPVERDTGNVTCE